MQAWSADSPKEGRGERGDITGQCGVAELQLDPGAHGEDHGAHPTEAVV